MYWRADLERCWKEGKRKSRVVVGRMGKRVERSKLISRMKSGRVRLERRIGSKRVGDGLWWDVERVVSRPEAGK